MSARRRVGVLLLPGLLVGVAVVVGTRQWDLGAVAGWDVAGLVFLLWTWREVWGLDEVASGRRAEREDPTAGVADLILTAAAVASLGAVRRRSSSPVTAAAAAAEQSPTSPWPSARWRCRGAWSTRRTR